MYWWQRFPRRLRLVFVLVSYLIGLAGGSVVSWPVSLVTVCISILLLGLFLLVRHFWLATVLLCISTMCVGFWWARTTVQKLIITESIEYSGQAMVVQSTLSSPPQTRVRLHLLEGTHKGHRIEGYTYDWTARVGTVLSVTTTIEPNRDRRPLGRGTIGQFKKLEVSEVVSPPRGLYDFRLKLIDRVGASLPEPYASLAVGLLTGVNDDFDTHFKEDLKRTGTSHIVAVSGANLTIVGMFLLRVTKRYGRWWAFGAAVFGLAFYAVIAGFNPSVMRGLVMASLALLAVTLGRVSHRLPLLLLTAVVLSVMFPLGMIYSLSWQLSFAAFTGIIFLGSSVGYYFRRFGAVGALLAETLAAELLVLPLIFGVFGEVSLIGPLVNMVVLLIVPLAMMMSLVQGVAAFVAIPLGRIVAWAVYPVLELIIWPIQWASQFSFAAYQAENVSPKLVIIVTLLVLCIAGFLLTRQHEANE